MQGASVVLMLLFFSPVGNVEQGGADKGLGSRGRKSHLVGALHILLGASLRGFNACFASLLPPLGVWWCCRVVHGRRGFWEEGAFTLGGCRVQRASPLINMQTR